MNKAYLLCLGFSHYLEVSECLPSKHGVHLALCSVGYKIKELSVGVACIKLTTVRCKLLGEGHLYLLAKRRLGDYYGEA